MRLVRWCWECSLTGLERWPLCTPGENTISYLNGRPLFCSFTSSQLIRGNFGFVQGQTGRSWSGIVEFTPNNLFLCYSRARMCSLYVVEPLVLNGHAPLINIHLLIIPLDCAVYLRLLQKCAACSPQLRSGRTPAVTCDFNMAEPKLKRDKTPSNRCKVP